MREEGRLGVGTDSGDGVVGGQDAARAAGRRVLRLGDVHADPGGDVGGRGAHRHPELVGAYEVRFTPSTGEMIDP